MRTGNPPRPSPARLALVALLSAVVAPGGAAAEPAAARAPAALPARAEAEAWSVALELPAALRAGEPALARIRLAARSGHHVNLEYPASFRPDGAATAAFAGPRVGLAVAERHPCEGRRGETCEVTLALPFTPGAAPTRISGLVSFSVCTADRCLIEKVALAAEVSSRTAASPR